MVTSDSAGDKFFSVFFFKSLLSEIKEFMESTGRRFRTLDGQWILDLAFLTDITGQLNHLNCELQGKGKTVSDMINTVNAFKAKMNIFSVHIEKKCATLSLCAVGAER